MVSGGDRVPYVPHEQEQEQAQEPPVVGSSKVWRLSLARDVATFRRDFESWVMFKLGTLCAAVFLLFSSSSIVSFVLGETQRRMLRFAVMLRELIEERRPVVWAVLSHAAGSLVFVPVILGVLFFLFEFFGDQLLALLALLAVWACEIYAAVACRTAASLQVFPFVFAVTFTWFFIYQFSYPFGAHYLALWGAVAGTSCTAAHLYLDYEIPALLAGWIHAGNMRDTAAGGPWEGIRTLLLGARDRHVRAGEALRRAREDLERIRARRRALGRGRGRGRHAGRSREREQAGWDGTQADNEGRRRRQRGRQRASTGDAALLSGAGADGRRYGLLDELYADDPGEEGPSGAVDRERRRGSASKR